MSATIKAFTREEIETALDAGRMQAAMANGKFWAIRRNGKTQLWKTRPNDYRIPVKAGLRSCGEIHQRSTVSAPGGGGDFIILPEAQ